jgi:hypothetical protein
MKKKNIISLLVSLLIFSIIFLPLTGFSNVAFAEDKIFLAAESNLIHGVVPTKVTGRFHQEYPDAAGALVIVDDYWEFWNVGKLGGQQYEKAKLTVVYTQNGPTTPSVWEGHFTGGPNGDLYVESKGYQIHAKLSGGKTITYGNGKSFQIDNPEAFNGWDDEEIEGKLTKPTIQLILVEGPVDIGNSQVKYTIKALVSGNPVPTVEFSRTPQDSISSTGTKNVITVVTGKNEILGLTATATNSEGSATASLGFPPPTIELVVKEGPIENPDKTVTYFIEAKVTGTPEPTVEFTTDDPAKVTALDNLNVKTTLNPGDNIVIEATAKNEFGQANSKIELSIQEKIKPTIGLIILTGPTDEGNEEYSYIVQANVTGTPEPAVKFNRDDSDGGSGKNKVTIRLAEGEEYTLTATAENSEGKVEGSIVLSAPSIPKIELEIIKGPVWLNITYEYYIVEAIIEGFPDPYVVWENPSGTFFAPYGKNKRIVYLQEEKDGKFSDVTISAYAKNDFGKSEKKSVSMSWQKPPEGSFTKRVFTVFENVPTKGKLLIKRANEKNWTAIVGSLTLNEGDSIKTLTEPAEIVASTRKGWGIIDPETELTVGSDENGNQILIDKGSLKLGLPENKDRNYSVQGKYGTANIKGTTFVFTTDENETVLKVIEGSVEFISSVTGDSVIINSGESVKADKTGLKEKTSFDLNTENDYWNKLESSIGKNQGVLSTIKNFLVNLQNKLNESGISDTLILVIGIGIICLIIALIVLIIFTIRARARIR